MKAEPSHHAVDQLAVAMLADQNVGVLAPVGQRHHELPPVPERDDDPFPLAIERIQRLGAFGAETQELPENPDGPGDQGGQDSQLQPVAQAFHTDHAS
jgi:hypothetical protein